jgi:hypothetical protein
MGSNELGFLDVAMMTFVPMAIAAALLRIKGVVGWLVIAAMVAVFWFVFTNLSGGQMFAGLLAAIAGLLVGGKISDWRERKRTERAAAVDRRERDSRFR